MCLWAVHTASRRIGQMYVLLHRRRLEAKYILERITHSKYELVCSYGAQMSVKCGKMAVQDKWDKIQKTYVLSTSQVQVTNPTRSNFPPRHRSRIRRASLRNSLTSSFIILSFSGLHALVRGLAAKHRELSSLEIFFSVLSLLTFIAARTKLILYAIYNRIA